MPRFLNGVPKIRVTCRSDYCTLRATPSNSTNFKQTSPDLRLNRALISSSANNVGHESKGDSVGSFNYNLICNLDCQTRRKQEQMLSIGQHSSTGLSQKANIVLNCLGSKEQGAGDCMIMPRTIIESSPRRAVPG